MLSVRVGENDVASYKAYMERDSEFHLLFFQILGNQRLLNIYRNLNAHIQIVRFRLLDRRGKNVTTDQEHERQSSRPCGSETRKRRRRPCGSTC